jgi:hypothetical protein
MAVCAELAQIGVDGDGMFWFDQCGAVPAGVLTELVEGGSAAGMASVLATTAAQPAGRLAETAGTVVIHRMTDPVTAERFARLTGEKLIPGGRAAGPLNRPGKGHLDLNGITFVRRPVVPPEKLCALADGEFALAVREPRRRLVPLGRVIPARLPAQHPAPAPGVPAFQRRPREPFGRKDRQPERAGQRR